MKTILAILSIFSIQAFAGDFKSVCDREFSIRYTLQKVLGKPCIDTTREDLQSIQKLELSTTNEFFRSADLVGLENLEVLIAHKVTNRDLSTVLDTLPKLRVLKLDFIGQAVSFVEMSASTKIFPNLTNLEVLELKNLKVVGPAAKENEILHLYPSVLEGHQKLTQLTIRDSNVAYLSFHLFEELPNLESADFTNNRIKSFTGLIFEDAPKLQSLALSGNELTGVEGLQFPGTVKPVTIYLCNVADQNVQRLKANSKPAEDLNFVTEGCL